MTNIVKTFETNGLKLDILDEGLEPKHRRGKFKIEMWFVHGDDDAETVDVTWVGLDRLAEAMDQAWFIFDFCERDTDMEALITKVFGEYVEWFTIPPDVTTGGNFNSVPSTPPRLSWVDEKGYTHLIEITALEDENV